jgi:uncharacterized membrane protein
MYWHYRHQLSMSFGDEIADWLSEHAGSWLSVWLHTCWFLLWFYLALDVNLLALLVTLEANFLCLFLLMSGNRQGERDRHQAEAGYRTNLGAKADVEQLMVALARIEGEKLDKSLAILVGTEMEKRASEKPRREATT